MKKLPFPTWLTRERENYFAEHGSSATEEGFCEHLHELVAMNPELARLMADDFVTAFLRERMD